jgi:hypothetical protein
MTDELDLVRAWTPSDAVLDDDAAGRARARLHAHLGAPPAGRRGRRRWLMVAAPAAVAGAVAVVLALSSGVQDGGVLPVPATAAQALEEAADAADRLPPAAGLPAPDQYLYVRSSGINASCHLGRGGDRCRLVTSRREAWQSLERTGRVTTGNRTPEPIAPVGTWSLGNERLSYAQMRDFDETGDQLLARLTAHHWPGQGGSLNAELFTQIGDAFREQPATPALRAALYRALKRVPGVIYLGPVRDRLARPALGVARVQDDRRSEILIDPRTSEMLAEQTRLLKASAGLAKGTVVEDVVYEQRGVVDRVGVRP